MDDGEGQAAAAGEHAGDLVQGAVEVADAAEDVEGDDKVESSVVEGQRLGVPDQVAPTGIRGTGELDQLGRDVDPGDRVSRGSERAGEPALAAAEVERRAPRSGEEVTELREPVVALLCPRNPAAGLGDPDVPRAQGCSLASSGSSPSGETR